MKLKLTHLALVFGFLASHGTGIAAEIVNCSKYNSVCADYAKDEICVVGSGGNQADVEGAKPE